MKYSELLWVFIMCNWMAITAGITALAIHYLN